MSWFDEYRKVNPWANDYSDAEIVQHSASLRGVDPVEFANYVGYELPSSNAGKSLASGWDNYKAGLQHVGAALGSETMGKWARQNEAEANLIDASNDAVKSFDDVHGISDLGSWVKHGAIQSLPYLAEFGTAALTGGGTAVARGIGQAGLRTIGGKAVERGAANLLKDAELAGIERGAAEVARLAADDVAKSYARTAAGVMGSYPSSVGTILSRQMEENGEYNLGAAGGLGVLHAAGNAVGLEGQLLRGMPRGLSASALRRAGVGFAEGALPEGGAETFQSMLERGGAGMSLTDTDALKEYRDSFLLGGALGGIPGAISAGAQGPAITRQEQHDLLNRGVETDQKFMQNYEYRLAEDAEAARDARSADFRNRFVENIENVDPSQYEVGPFVSPVDSFLQARAQQGMTQDMFTGQYSTSPVANVAENPVVQGGDQQTLDMFYPNGQPTYNASMGPSEANDAAYMAPRTSSAPVDLRVTRTGKLTEKPLVTRNAPANIITGEPVPAPSTGGIVVPGNETNGVMEYVNAQRKQASGQMLTPYEAAILRQGMPSGNSQRLVLPEQRVVRNRQMELSEQARMSKAYGFTPSFKLVPMIQAAEQAVRQGQISQDQFEQVINAATVNPKKAAAALETLMQGAANEPTPVVEGSSEVQRDVPTGGRGAVPADGQRGGVDRNPATSVRGSGAPAPVGNGTPDGELSLNAAQTEQVAQEAVQAQDAQVQQEPAATPDAEGVGQAPKRKKADPIKEKVAKLKASLQSVIDDREVAKENKRAAATLLDALDDPDLNEEGGLDYNVREAEKFLDSVQSRRAEPVFEKREPAKSSSTTVASANEAPRDAGRTRLQRRATIGKALGAVVSAGGHYLRGRRNKRAGAAIARGDTKALLQALSASKNELVRFIAEKARALSDLKVKIDENGMEEHTRNARSNNDIARNRIEELDAFRESADLTSSLSPESSVLEPLRKSGILDRDVFIATEDGEARSISFAKVLDGWNIKTKKQLDERLAFWEEIVARDGEDVARRAAAGMVTTNPILGAFYPETNTVTIADAYFAEDEHTVTHELTHAVTVHALTNPTRQQRPIVEKLTKLYEHVKAQLDEDYGVSSVEEFVAEGFSNGDFQAKLADIEYEQTTAWGEFTKRIANLLGWTKSNALTELIALTEELTGMESNRTSGASPKYLVQQGQTSTTNSTAAATADAAKQARITFTDLAKKGMLSSMMLDAIVKAYKNTPIYAALKAYKSEVEKLGAKSRLLTSEGHPLLEAWQGLGKDVSSKMSTALTTASVTKAWGNLPFEHPDNAHLRKPDPMAEEGNRKLPEEKRKQLIDSYNEDIAAGRKDWEQARAAYEALPQNARELYVKLLKFAEKFVRMEYSLRAKSVLDTNMPMLRESLDTETANKVESYFRDVIADIDGKNLSLIDARRTLRDKIKGLNNPSAMSAFRDLENYINGQVGVLRETKGPYFPLMRFGEFVVVVKSDTYKVAHEAVDAIREKLSDFHKKSGALSDLRKATAEHAYWRKKFNSKPTPAGKEHLDALKQQVAEAREKAKGDVEKVAQLRGELRKAMKELDTLTSDEKHYIMQKHETRGAAEMAAERYRKAGRMAESFESTQYLEQEMPASSGFINKVKDRMLARMPDGAGDKARRILNQVFVESMHDRSSLKRLFLSRKGTNGVSGFSLDGERVFASMVMQGSHRLANLEHFSKVQDALDTLSRQAAKSERAGEGNFVKVANEIVKRYALDMTYDETPIINKVAQLNHIWTLGLAPMYLVQNMLQTPMLGIPMLNGKFSKKLGTKAVLNQYGKSWGDAKNIIAASIKKQGAKYSIDIDSLNLPADEKAMLRDLHTKGSIDILMEHDVGETASGTRAWKHVNNIADVINWPARQIETHNRLSSALVSYRLAKQSGMDTEAAVEYAAEFVSESQVNYTNENAPRWMKRGAFTGVRLVTQFRKYQVAVAGMLIQNATLAFKGDVEARNTVFGILGTHMLMTGMMGTALYWPVTAIANLIGGMIDDDDEPFDFELWLKNAAGSGGLGEVATRGLLSQLGVDVVKNVGQGDIFNPVPFMRVGKDANQTADNLLVAMAPPAYTTGKRMFSAIGNFANGDVQQGLINGLPRWMRDPIKAMKLADEGITTKHGNTRMGPEMFSGIDVTLQALGVKPLEVSKYYERTGDFYNRKGAADDTRSRLVEQWREDGARPEDIDGFNTRHPDNRITYKDVIELNKRKSGVDKNLRENGIRAGKREQSIADGINY